jgi:hypothetical protein
VNRIRNHEKEDVMNTSTETETKPEPEPAEEPRVDGLGGFGLVHLAACLGVGGAVVLAINLIEWLR